MFQKIRKKSKGLTKILIYKKLHNPGKIIEILKNVIVCQSLVLTVVLDSFPETIRRVYENSCMVNGCGSVLNPDLCYFVICLLKVSFSSPLFLAETHNPPVSLPFFFLLGERRLLIKALYLTYMFSLAFSFTFFNL